MAFPLVSKPVTMNGVIAVILRYLIEFGTAVVANYFTVVIVRLIVSATKM